MFEKLNAASHLYDVVVKAVVELAVDPHHSVVEK